MAVDPVTIAKLWLTIRPIRRLKERRSRKRAEKTGQAVPVETEVSMDVKVFLIQAVLAVLRHAMTASPFAAMVTDDWLLQTATVIVGIGGFLWSLKRKMKPAQSAG